MFTSLRLRLRALFRRKQLERDLEDELAFHLAMKAEKLGGVIQARRQFGNVTWFRERCRELWSLGPVEILWQDVRYGARMLRRSPAFTAVAVLSLALGMGANTLIFSFVNAVLLKSLPVRNPHELRVLNWTGWNPSLSNYSGSGFRPGKSGQTVAGSFSYPIYRAFRDRSTSFSDVVAFAGIANISVVYRGQAFTSEGMIASGNLFTGLGAHALFGRTFTAEDDRPGAPSVAVVSHHWWERYAGLDPGILGQSVMLNGSPYTIVGVLPRDFVGPLSVAPIDLYVPLSNQPQFVPSNPLNSAEHWWLEIMARLKPGVDERQARAQLEALFVPMANTDTSKQKIERPGIALEDGRTGTLAERRKLRLPLFLVMAMVGLVLMIACANLASLLLARGAARRHEMALRAAIGAGRLRLIRQSIVESLMISLAGGAVGLALATLGRTPVLSLVFAPGEGPRLNMEPDLRVLAFTLGAALLTALLFGLLPALRASSVDPAAGLKSEPGRAAPRLRLGKTLVAAQMGLSLLLVVGAGLLARTLVNYWNVDPGFRADGLLLFRLNAETAGYKGQQLVDYYERVRASVSAIPGVLGVSSSNVALVSGSVWAGGFTIPGRALKPGEHLQAHQLWVGDSFLATMGIPLLLGRDLSASDTAAAPKVVVVNETFARSFFPDENPVGKSIAYGRFEYRIVGLCRDARYNSLEKTPPTLYFPYQQHPEGIAAMFFDVRTAVPPLSVGPAVRRAVAALDPNVPLTNLKTQVAQIAESISSYRTFAILCGFFAALALMLSAIGLYGVVAYTVARRTGEIGVRMALGASRGNVLRVVLRDALLLAAAGAAFGIPLAAAATRMAQSELFGIKPNDPTTIAGAVALLLAVALLAAWVPARRAATIDPVTALRSE